ncbi:MAG: phosphoesterase PA-phosphatase related [Hyphomicrobiales bacterium]|nr:phosphoesterase PA-phosphatase related [Hyphomicrobiales bacterium]
MFDFTLDQQIRAFLISVTGQSASLQAALTACAQLYSVKLLPMFTVLVYCWFNDPELRGRRYVMDALVSIAVALLVSRIAQNLLPVRLRPLQEERMGGFTEDISAGDHWSSFPSDHAALAFALTVAMFYYSRRLGAFCLAWSIFVVTLPRIFVGLHYPTDVAAGALVGVLSAIAVHAFSGSRPTLYASVQNAWHRWPGLAAAGCFAVMFTLTTMAEDARRVARVLLNAMIH